MSQFRSHKWYLQEDAQLALYRAVRSWLQEKFGPVTDGEDWVPTFKGKDPEQPSYFQLLDLRGWDPASDQNDGAHCSTLLAVGGTSCLGRVCAFLHIRHVIDSRGQCSEPRNNAFLPEVSA